MAALGLAVRLEPALGGEVAQVAGGLALAEVLVGLVAAAAHPAADESLVQGGHAARVEPVAVHLAFEQRPHLARLGQALAYALGLQVVGAQAEAHPRERVAVRLPVPAAGRAQHVVVVHGDPMLPQPLLDRGELRRRDLVAAEDEGLQGAVAADLLGHGSCCTARPSSKRRTKRCSTDIEA
ncbi:hypothetical protein [Nonomuraea bangladeshensis]|uniref:hypothetical protein n=1 Tax=Nonomuraea bangladeshensis TaxID=404385 RepID=UPI003C2ECF7C